jgi:hypothetical protein
MVVNRICNLAVRQLYVWRERGGSDYCRAAIQQQHCEENNVIVASTWQIQLLRLEGLVRMPEAGIIPLQRHYGRLKYRHRG